MNSSPKVKKSFLLLFIITLSVAFLLISYFRLLDRFELISLDFRYELRPNPPTNQDIALIEISEDSLKTLGRWPFPRDYHANLIAVLGEAGARMVIFDILFSEPTAWDEALAKSAREFGKAYFSFAFRLEPAKHKGILKADSIDAPLLNNLSEASAGTGFINKLVDIDGKTRKVPLFVNFQDKLYPHLSLKAACDYLNIPLEPVIFDGRGALRVGEKLVIPTDGRGAVLLNFVDRWVESFSHYSYLDILAAYYELKKGQTPRIDLGKLKGKVCFVGLTAAGTHELGPVPIEKSYPMLGVGATLFNMITEGTYLRRLSPLQNLGLLVVFSALFFLSILAARPLKGLLIAVGSISLIFILSTFLFALAGIWIDVVAPATTLMVIYLGVTLNRSIVEIKKRLQIEQELAVARSIQQSLLPEETPKIEGLDVASRIITAKEVGGDLYDVIGLDEDKLGIMIGDVSGKGIPAALFMAKVTTLFKIFARGQFSPAKVLKLINGELARDCRSGLFVTLLYAIFDKDKKSLIFSSAGHLPVVVLRTQDHNIEVISHEEGMAAGIMEDVEFFDKEITLLKGDVVVLYTDGVTEAMDMKRHEFGIEGLKKSLQRPKNGSAQQILNLLLDNIRNFQGRAPQHDDITAILLDIR